MTSSNWNAKQLCATERVTVLGHRKGSGIGDHPCVCVRTLVCGVWCGAMWVRWKFGVCFPTPPHPHQANTHTWMITNPWPFPALELCSSPWHTAASKSGETIFRENIVFAYVRALFRFLRALFPQFITFCCPLNVCTSVGRLLEFPPSPQPPLLCPYCQLLI